MSVSTGMVTLCYLAIAGAGFGLWLTDPVINKFYLILAGALALLFLLSSLYTNKFDTAFVYRLYLIPIFVLLGWSSRANIAGIVSKLLLVILGVAIFELAFTDQYIAFCDPLSYYTSTRSWTNTGEGTNAEANLYLGAYRIGGTLFGASHRAGSIFIEPLSLGYFATIAVIFTLSDASLPAAKKVLPILICLLLGILADTRLSVALSTALVLGYPLLRRIPLGAVSVLPIPLFVLGALVYANAGLIGGDLGGRLAWTYGDLAATGPAQLFLGGIDATNLGDAGLVNLITHVGLIGCFIFFQLASGAALRAPATSFLCAAVMVYLFMGSLFGGAMLSLKTGAILGFGIGVLARQGVSAVTAAMEVAAAESRKQDEQ
ncbi:hypothetical protein HT051_12500 [Methyloligella sp. GL2]|nr:hypothetical protein HT051_12500 [Methyloligella sp. GL2]